MAVTDAQLHALSHTARILVARAVRPNHPRELEYARQLKIYAGQWAAMSDGEKVDAVEAMRDVPDLSSDQIAHAVAALEA